MPGLRIRRVPAKIRSPGKAKDIARSDRASLYGKESSPFYRVVTMKVTLGRRALAAIL